MSLPGETHEQPNPHTCSGGTNKPITVQVAGTDAGQDVGDRGIAHIVTGGLARA